MSGFGERHGQVIDADGAPVAGARIVIPLSSAPMPEIAFVSDAQGRFALRLPEGRFTLRAHGPNGLSGEVEIQVGGAARAEAIVIAIGRQ